MPAGSDAGIDAPSSDGPVLVTLHVQITGRGSVLVADRGTCSSQQPQDGNCTYEVALGIAQSVFAIERPPEETFVQWSSTTCTGQGTSCTFTPVGETFIVAHFESSRVRTQDEPSARTPSAHDARAAAPRSRDAARPRPILAHNPEFFAERAFGPPVAQSIPHGERDDADRGSSALAP
jgi:hypothetical protein